MEVKVTILPGQSIAAVLQNLLQQGAQQAKAQDRAVLVSLSERHWLMDAVELFDRARQVTAERFFWSQPGKGFSLVGLGIAYALDAVEGFRFRQIGTSWRHILRGAILEGLRGLPGVGPLIFGGFAFDPDHPSLATSELWRGFGEGRMILPRVLYTIKDKQAWVTYNVVVTPDTDPDAEAAALASLGDEVFTGASTEQAPTHHSYTETPLIADNDWKSIVARTAQDIADGLFEKVVLARAVKLESNEPFETASALNWLSANYPDTNVFAVARGQRCFLGATPERLAEVHDGTLRTMSLAGTARRGHTEDEDHTLGDTLMHSHKNRHEHVIVRHMLVETLTPMCSSLEVEGEPSLLRLSNVQHLCTRFIGKLLPNTTLLDVVERLHPTPAVGGRPKQSAIVVLREREKLDRGWYAGPVGWIDAQGGGEFVVALRSAMVEDRKATLFAGCGIVADSNPELEFVESSLKLKPMLAALAGN
jgi:menaquinone-specific isochorismate synthase